MWEPTPWFVRNGKHSPALARTFANAAVGGNPGIVEPTSCKVTPLDVPGQGVKVGPGAVLIPNSAPGGGQQMYVVRNPQSETFLGTSPTSSTGPRTDLIAVVIRDPEYPGTSEPADYDTYQFANTEVIEGVAANVKRLQDVPGWESVTGFALARITRPASTGTIEQSHITDLRKMAINQTSVVRRFYNPAEAAPTDILTSTTAVRWPSGAAWDIEIPSWATHAAVTADWANVGVPGGDVRGWLSFSITEGGTLQSNAVRYDAPNVESYSRISYKIGEEMAIPLTSQGKIARFQMRGYRQNGTVNLHFDNGSCAILDVTFLAKPV